MKPNPISHVIEFLTQPAWTTAVYWLLMLGTVAIAAYALATIESQRTARDVGSWACRFVIGSMWWQQTLRKTPPYYTDQPSHPMDSGLAYWVTEMGKSAWIPLQADFVNNIVLPHLYLFAPMVYRVDGDLADPGHFRAFLERHRCPANYQLMARPLRCSGRMAVDLLLPNRPASGLRARPIRPPLGRGWVDRRAS